MQHIFFIQSGQQTNIYIIVSSFISSKGETISRISQQGVQITGHYKQAVI